MTRFSNHIPDYIHQYKIFAPYSGVWGAIYCIMTSILLFGDIAKSHNIDPGRPEVPIWGRKLHSLQFNNDKVQKQLNFPASICPFGAMVIDIDGPIREEIVEELNRLLKLGLTIGFATGRGGSAIDLLREGIRQEFWDKVTVGLYNGTCIIKLSEEHIHLSYNQLPMFNELSQLVRDMCKKYEIDPSIRPTQITVRDLLPQQLDLFKVELCSALGQKNIYFKIISSGHSIDIIPRWGSKLMVVENIDQGLEFQILCVGDQGQIGGNDEELLRWQPSISVGRKRPVSNKCLWLGKDEKYRESAGMLALLKAIKKNETKFIIDEGIFKM
jgi:hydroxymethylpyrimidine pyrophosphatase-like HAD family hydrolase